MISNSIDINKFNEFKCEHKFDNDQLASLSDHQFVLPDNLGSGISYGFSFNKSSMLQLSDLSFPVDTHFTNGEGPLCGAFIVLEGVIEVEIEGYGCLTASANQAGLFFLNNATCHCHYRAGNVRLLNFSIDQELMASLAQGYENSPITNMENGGVKVKNALWLLPIPHELNLNIKQIYQCDLPKASGKLLIQAKVLEILTQLFEIRNQRQKAWPNIKSRDLDAIFNAANLVVQKMQTPANLIELAHSVGINDNKLKKLFKQVFSQTVFDFLHQKRMEKAVELVSQTELPIKEIATLIGLKHAGNFASHFKAFTGKTPKEFRKK